MTDDELLDLLEWVTNEIDEKSKEIEELGHAGHDRQKVRAHGRKVGFNHGLRHVRDELRERLKD